MKTLKSSLLAVLVLLSLSAVSQTQLVTYKFNNPEVLQNPDKTTILKVSGCRNYGKEGNPLMPYFGADVLLPQGHSVENVNVIDVIYGEIYSDIEIQAAAGQFPISKGAPDNYSVKRNKDVYKSKNAFPSSIVENVSTHFLSGHSIASFTLCPVIYYPAEKKIKWIREIKLELVTSSSEKAQKARNFLRNDNRTLHRLSRVTDNPEMLDNYKYSKSPIYDEYDILFISNQAFLSFFDNYIYFKESTGFAIKTISVEEIYSSYTGQDDQEKIRNCIIDYYTNWGIMSVILAGDADPDNSSDLIVPHRGFFGTIDNDYDVPADMYYSCLDGTWNDDNDAKWGEPGEDDLFEEISVGRLCVDSQTEADNMINKLIMYQDEPVIADIEKSLMLGESLDSYTWGGDSKDEVADGSSNHGFTTVGVSSNFSTERLYERDSWWNKNSVFDEFNNTGINLLNHLGHSNVTYNMKMSNSDINTSNFTNDGVNRGYVIGYSQGCYNGSFDNRKTGGSYSGDCFAEKITTISTAEVASVANSRYGLYSPGNTNGASQYFDREFYDAIFGENLTMIGEANGDSKSDNAGFIEQSSGLRWCCYELNVLGDPTMDIWTATPSDISATYPASLPLGATQIVVTTDAPYCRLGIMQDSALVGRAIADQNGIATVNFFNPLNIQDDLELSIICHNRNRYQDSVVVINNQPYVAYNDHTVNDPNGNSNGMPEYGEEVFLSLEMTNLGNQDAHNVNVTVSSDDPHASIIDSAEYYGDIPAGQSLSIQDGFTIELSDSVPNNHMIIYTAKAEGEDTWLSNFFVSACAPNFTFNSYAIDDTISGNGNGILDPGETATMILHTVNSGLSTATDIETSISSDADYINIIDSIFTIDTLNAGEQCKAEFTVSADQLAPPGTAQIINCLAVSGAYEGEDQISVKTGLICEDWETGDFNKFNWLCSGSENWTIDTNIVFEGSYSSKSGNIGNSATSYLKITLNALEDDSVSFYRKVSSENNSDFLRFTLDSEILGEWSGDKDWEKFTYAVTSGVHTLQWYYTKDGNNSGGDDAAWLDYIILPQISVASSYAGEDQEICGPDNCQLLGEAANYHSIEWTTSGSGTFSDISILDPVYSPSQNDINSGSVTLTLEAMNNQSGTSYDNMLLSFEDAPLPPDPPSGPEYVNTYISPQTTYTTNPVSGVNQYIWKLDPENAGTIINNDTAADIVWNPTCKGEVLVKVASAGDSCNSLYSELLVLLDYSTGMDETNQHALKVYPNPAHSKLNIYFNNTSDRLYKIIIYNTMGETVYIKHVNSSGNISEEINLEKISKGLYIVSVQTETTIINKRILIR